MYNTIFLPLVDYCSSVWDSCGEGSKIYLYKLNRRTTCIIEGRCVGADEFNQRSAGPAYKRAGNILKVCLVYKCRHDMTPSYLLSEFRHAHQIHSYNTRRRDLLRLPLAKTAKYQGSFRINGTRAYKCIASKHQANKGAQRILRLRFNTISSMQGHLLYHSYFI